MSLAHEIALVTVVSTAQLLTQAGLAMVLSSEHIIGDFFGADNTSSLSWYAAAYSLTVGKGLPPATILV
jgi:hypothetical protein